MVVVDEMSEMPTLPSYELGLQPVRPVAERPDLASIMNKSQAEVESCLRREGLYEVSVNALAVSKKCVEKSRR